MPADTVGEETQQDPIRMKNCLDRAEQQLVGLGASAVPVVLGQILLAVRSALRSRTRRSA